ncbi:aldehyde dehydrogenase family protein [Paenibacillus sp. M1]|uniref:Aldehyde dehydrogenase family protein n=1 Tax=Paenibacillus haidiansis TaxID=1574488 RepID=A0ABU7VUP3_9BACL
MNLIESVNPFNALVIGRVKESSIDEVHEAVIRAKKACSIWGGTGLEERISLLEPLIHKLEEHRGELAELLVTEVGRPILEAEGEVRGAMDNMRVHLVHAREYLADQTFLEDRGVTHTLRRVPWGVSAVISPFNVPLNISEWGIIPNLLCGNTVIYKPSEYTPLVGEYFSKLILELGLPPGTFHLLQGDGKVGERLIHEAVDFIWFTGSTSTGTHIFEVAGKRFISSLMELGGNNPTIICEDVEISDDLISNLIQGRFQNCGQVCSAIKRLYVHQSKYEELVAKLAHRAQALKVGDPANPSTEIGPLVSERQLLLLEEQVADAVAKGAGVACGGRRSADFPQGSYYLPTVLTGVHHGMRIMNEEVFGPVLPVMAFNDPAEAVELANDSLYGLAAEIYCNNEAIIDYFTGALQTGRVAVNMPRFAGLNCPMGGMKKSGKGRQHGKWVFEELTQIKHIMTRS